MVKKGSLTKKTKDKFDKINLDEFKKFWATHNDTEVELKFDLSYKQYKKYCELNNIVKTKERFIFLQERTRQEVYGDPHYRNSQKALKTREERYGSSSYHNIEKMKETNLKRYGHEYGFNYDKSKITCLEKYGYEYCSQNEDIKTKARTTNLERYGVVHPVQLSEFRSKMRSKYLYKGINFDSGWELAYYIWLVDNNLNFEYHPQDYFIYQSEDGEHRYQPDFLVENLYVEIKSKYFLEKKEYLDKINFIKNNNIKIITEPEIYFYLDYVKDNYGDNYLHSFKNV